MSPVVRSLTAADIPLIGAWLPAVPLMQNYGMTVEKAQRQFTGALERQDCVFVVDIPGQTACGFAWLLPQGAFGRSPYVRLIAVDNRLTGQGLGAALLDAAEAWAGEVSADIFLLVSDFNTDAQRFYTRRGYQHIGTISGFVVANVNELIFRKVLR
jgi:GNAT superfamily N-acetyltransferase